MVFPIFFKTVLHKSNIMDINKKILNLKNNTCGMTSASFSAQIPVSTVDALLTGLYGTGPLDG